MSAGAKIWTTAILSAVASVTVPFVFLWWLLPVCDGDGWSLLVAIIFPFAALGFLAPDGLYLIRILACLQFPVYGICLGRAWLRDNLFSALVLLAVHFAAAVTAVLVLILENS